MRPWRSGGRAGYTAAMAPLALAALLLAAPSEAKMKEAPPAPAALVRAAVSFKAPAGWKESAHANGPDPVLELRSGLDRIVLRVFGGAGSAYATPELFLKGPAAGTLGSAPQPAGEARVAGRALTLYEHGYPIMQGDPHVPSPGGRPPLAIERYVLLPLPGGRFVVAGHAYESPIPSADPAGAKAFAAFLETLKPAPAKKRR